MTTTWFGYSKPLCLLVTFLLIVGHDSTAEAVRTDLRGKKNKNHSTTAPFIIESEEKNEHRIQRARGVAHPTDSQTDTFKSAYTWYSKSCKERPFLTKGTTAGIIGAIGDLIAQKLESGAAGGDRFVVNTTRILTFFLCGALYTAPFVHIWYGLLEKFGRWMEGRYGASKVRQLVAQVMVDQTVGVALYFPLYFYVYDIFESLLNFNLPSLPQATEKCVKSLGQVLLVQYRIFPMTNAINFSFVPPELRALYSNSVSLFWNIYLCSVVA